MLVLDRLPQQVGIFAFITLATFLLAHSINGVVSDALTVPVTLRPVGLSPPLTPGVPESDALRQAEEIIESGIFPAAKRDGLRQEAGEGSITFPLSTIEAARKIALLGTVVGEAAGVLAIVEELATKRQALYRLGDVVPGIGEVAEIRRNAVLFRQGSQEEWLELAIVRGVAPPGQATMAAAAGRQPGAPLRKILDRREVAAATDDISKLLTQARAAPYLIAGKLEGYRIEYVVPQSFFDKVGMRVGDVLQRVNGIELKDPGTMLALFQQVKNERTVRLDVLRENQRTTFTYEIR
jgi:general secretion pathway protein C